MFATLEKLQNKLDARAEYQQGEEQSRLREQMRTDYDLQDFIEEQFEMDNYSDAIFELIETIKDKVNKTQKQIITLQNELTNPQKNYYVLKVEIKNLRKELARMVSETIEDFGGVAVYNKLKNKYIEDSIFNETELTKMAKRRL